MHPVIFFSEINCAIRAFMAKVGTTSMETSLSKKQKTNRNKQTAKVVETKLPELCQLPGLIDIGVNLLDPMYRGHYRGKQLHDDDLSNVIYRSKHAGVEKMIVTAGTLSEAKEALTLVENSTCNSLFSTVGVHPTRCGEFRKHPGGSEAYMASLIDLIRRGGEKVVAVGECGLDFDRLQFCDKKTQLEFFEAQFELAEKSGLPMFLHCRNAATEFIDILKGNLHRVSGGASSCVVHSFDGTWEEAEGLLALGCHIGINGCYLKKPENLAVASRIPLDRLHIETDGPWCDIRPTHAGFKYVKSVWPTKPGKRHDAKKLFECVKNRTEPCHLRQVLEVLAGARDDVDMEKLATITSRNSRKVFFK
eukprot:g5011.t1